MQASAGAEAPPDGPAEIQLAGMGLPPALGGQLPIDLPGHGLNQIDGLGNLRIPESPDVPAQKPQLRVKLFGPYPGIFQKHLLLHHGLGKHGVDEFAVELGAAVHIALVAVQEVLQLLAGLLRQLPVVQPLLVAELYPVANLLQLLLGLLPLGLPLLLLLRPLPGLGPNGLLREKKAVESSRKFQLLLPGLGIDGHQGGFHRLPVRKAKLR